MPGPYPDQEQTPALDPTALAALSQRPSGGGLFGTGGGMDDPMTAALFGMSKSFAEGKGMSGFMEGYQQGLQIQKQKQQNALNEQFTSMLNNPTKFSPDMIEAAGMKAGLTGHPGAATLMKIADARRAQEANDVEFGRMKSGEGYGGLFGTLLESPHVGAEAKVMQDRIDKADKGSAAEYKREYDKLREQHFKMEEAKAKREQEPLVAVIKNGKPVLVKRSQAEGMTPAANASSSAPVTNTDLHGAEYAATLDPTTRNIAEGLANYTINPQTLSNRAGERKQMLAHARQINPSYDQNQFTARAALRKDFTAGKAATNVTAINTAIGHIATLDQLYDSLQNGDTQAVNAVVNAVRQQTGDPRVNNAQIAIGAVSNELMRVFRQVGASEAEIKDWEKRFTTNMSRGQSKGAVKTSAELLESRINALNDQWDRGMNTKGGFPNMISPKSAQFLEKVRTPAATSNGGWSVRVKE